MPTVQKPDGTWMQDSSEIIDTFEAAFPDPSIVPDGARQRLASLLLELHGDEWLPIVALHYRWNVPENLDFAVREFARYGLPGVPSFLSRRLIRPFSDKMRGYRPIVGITESTIPGIERFTQELITCLDKHLKEHDYLLGGRPCIGDFALYGPLWAHLFRDPGSTHLFSKAPHIQAWFKRLQKPPKTVGEFLPKDEVPKTLDPIFRTLFTEQMAFVRDLVAAIDGYCEKNPGATRVPRSLGDHDFTIGGVSGKRRLLTFAQWMAQRPMAVLAEADTKERGRIYTWLKRVGGTEAMDFAIQHPFERRGFKMGLA